MHSLLQDIAYGVRSMRRNLVVSTTAIVVLALGIGANAAVFSVVNRVLLEPLPYPGADRLVQIFCGSPMGQVLVTSVPKFVAWREQRGVLEHVAAFGSAEPLRVSIGGTPRLTAGVRVSADYFPVFGVNTIIGRPFTRNEDHPGGPPVALISQGFWRRHWPNGSPLRDRISLSPYVRRELADLPRIIVGIVDDVRDGAVNQPEPMLNGVTTTAPVVFVGVALLLTFVALAATFVSARRATSIHPNEVLRHG
jgi:ABC-type antimicrobial peptide transport system permease subunit